MIREGSPAPSAASSPAEPSPFGAIAENDLRGCDLCGSKARKLLYAQRFAAFDDASSPSGYDVVACSTCGFVYADKIPDQSRFDEYYSAMSKYEVRDDAGDISPTAAANYRSIVAEVGSRLPDKQLRILDIGCGAGHLLAAFRAAGYARVTGFDPSARCAEFARRRYGIDVVNSPISEMAATGERFDLILLSSVLEHLRDLGPTVRGLTGLLDPAGAIWFEVPDAARFADDVGVPFQQFSLEHINFFTRDTLVALLEGAGCAPSDLWSATRLLGTLEDPALDGIFRRVEDGVSAAHADTLGPACVATYVARSKELESRLVARIEPLIRDGRPVVIWGAGTLTLHLLRNERLAGLPIKAFVDANRNYHHKTIFGRPVLAPEELSAGDAVVLVVSRAYEREIVSEIRDRYGLRNRVVTLFSEASDRS